MLNEPFRILDNIPLIWCFASFETYQSGVLEIVTQKWGLIGIQPPTQTGFCSVLTRWSALSCVFTPIMHRTQNLVPLFLPAPRPGNRISSRARVCEGGGEEMRDEKWGGYTSNCLLWRHVEPVWRRDTGLGGSERGGNGGVWGWTYVINLSSALMFQNKDGHLALIFVACSADGPLR